MHSVFFYSSWILVIILSLLIVFTLPTLWKHRKHLWSQRKYLPLKLYFSYFRFLARRYIAPRNFPRKRPRPFIVGITGSVGKTSSRMIITDILKKYFPDKKIYTSPKNFNGELGLSLSILGINSYTPSIL